MARKTLLNQYKAQIKRIKQFISRAEKRGYSFDFSLPQTPGKVSKKDVNKLKNITPDFLYSKSVYGGLASFGEIVPGLEGRKLERSLAAKKATQTKKYNQGVPSQEPTNEPGFVPPENVSTDFDFFDRVTILSWYNTLNMFTNGEAYNLLRAWMDNTVAANGVHNTAVMLERAYDNGVILTWEIAYKGEAARMYIGTLIDFIPDQGVIYKESVMDKLQYMSRLDEVFDELTEWGEII